VFDVAADQLAATRPEQPTTGFERSCKIAGIAYTGSNPVPATTALSCRNVTAARAVAPVCGVGFPSVFPPADEALTPPAFLGAAGITPSSASRAPPLEQVDEHALGEQTADGSPARAPC
jgi:hypothetical protein